MAQNMDFKLSVWIQFCEIKMELPGNNTQFRIIYTKCNPGFYSTKVVHGVVFMISSGHDEVCCE